MRSAKDEFQELVDEFEHDPEYVAYGLVSDFVDDVCRVMEAKGLTRRELANKLGVTPQYVTKFLNSTENTSVHQLVRFAQALGMDVRLSLSPKAPVVQRPPSSPSGQRRSPRRV